MWQNVGIDACDAPKNFSRGKGLELARFGRKTAEVATVAAGRAELEYGAVGLRCL